MRLTIQRNSETGAILSRSHDQLEADLRDDSAVQRLYRTVERCAHLPRGSLQVRELVAEVFEDLFTGDTPRDPQRPLATQLNDEVRCRAKQLRRDARRVGLVELTEAPRALCVDSERDALTDEDEAAPDAACVVYRIRDLTRNDVAVLQLLDLMAKGPSAAPRRVPQVCRRRYIAPHVHGSPHAQRL